jgi:outer membrane PBP1 activator LpoA protein
MSRNTKHFVRRLHVFIVIALLASACDDHLPKAEMKHINDSVCVEARKYAESYENEADAALANNDIASHASYKAMAAKVLENCN